MDENGCYDISRITGYNPSNLLLDYSQRINNNGIANPPDDIPEWEKFVLNSEGQPLWFLDKARWIVANFYNQSHGHRLYSYNSNTLPRFNDYITENMTYYFGKQDNPYGEVEYNGKLFNPGQDIRKYVSNMRGNMENIVKGISEDNINATCLNPDVMEKKKTFFTLLEYIRTNKQHIMELRSQGIEILPAMLSQMGINDPADMTIEDVEDIKNEWKDSFEIAAEALTSAYFNEFRVAQALKKQATNQLIANVSTIIFENYGDCIVPVSVDLGQEIFDTTATDVLQADAIRWGYVKSVTLQQLFDMIPDMPKEVHDDIVKIATAEDGMGRAALNTGFQNVTWWGRQREVTIAKVWWTGKRNVRKMPKETATGTRHITLKDKEQYDLRKFGLSTEKKLEYGSYIKSPHDVWDIHTCLLVGNKYVFNFGYEPVIDRDYRGVPIPNMTQLVSGRVQGVFDSIVSRLKGNQIEKDRLKEKIKSKTFRDKGKNYIIYAENVDQSVRKMIEDFDAMNITVVVGTTGEAYDKGRDKRIGGETIDLSLDNSIQQYIALIAQEQQEMSEITSIPDIARGQQQSIVGKAVQENTITQSTLGNLEFYNDYITFCIDVLNKLYNLNRLNLVNIENPKNMPIGVHDTQILEQLQEFSQAQMQLYIKPNDSIDSNLRVALQQYIQALSQNVQYMQEQGLDAVDILKLMQPNTFGKMLRSLSRKVRLAKKRMQEQQMAQNEQQMAAQQQAEQQALYIQQVIAENKEANANYRELIKLIGKNPAALPIAQGVDPEDIPLVQ